MSLRGLVPLQSTKFQKSSSLFPGAPSGGLLARVARTRQESMLETARTTHTAHTAQPAQEGPPSAAASPAMLL